jgi:hypothetical protein
MDVAKQRGGFRELPGFDLSPCKVHERGGLLRVGRLAFVCARLSGPKDVTEHEVIDEPEQSQLSCAVQWGR